MAHPEHWSVSASIAAAAVYEGHQSRTVEDVGTVLTEEVCCPRRASIVKPNMQSDTKVKEKAD